MTKTKITKESTIREVEKEYNVYISHNKNMKLYEYLSQMGFPSLAELLDCRNKLLKQEEK
jgi:hypothetical protein